MRVTATVNDKVLQKKIDKQLRDQPRQIEKLLGKTAEFLMGLIKQRTQRGKSADGLRFAPYTPEYKAFRRKKGRQSVTVCGVWVSFAVGIFRPYLRVHFGQFWVYLGLTGLF